MRGKPETHLRTATVRLFSVLTSVRTPQSGWFEPQLFTFWTFLRRRIDITTTQSYTKTRPDRILLLFRSLQGILCVVVMSILPRKNVPKVNVSEPETRLRTADRGGTLAGSPRRVSFLSCQPSAADLVWAVIVHFLNVFTKENRHYHYTKIPQNRTDAEIDIIFVHLRWPISIPSHECL